MLQSDSFIFLLGAGASFDAKIPVSAHMIKLVEKLIIENEDWKPYKDLYYCIKSGIINGAGITGNFSSDIINIEILVNTMEELLKSYEHPLYPFIGSWIPRLNEVCNNKFDEIVKLKKLIVDKLCTDWTKCNHSEDYSYYSNFLKLQKDYNFPLSIFSLNYDLCVENAVGKSNVQRGFGIDHLWQWQNLEDESQIAEPIRLYKLHGSMDWKKTNTGEVEESDNAAPDKVAIIFGTAYKLQYVDPFLYLVNVFRKKTLAQSTKGIICVGYSFNDEHINGIISQSLKKNCEQKIISIAPIENENSEKNRILEKLNGNISDERLILVNKKAKEWLETVSCKEIESYLGANEEPF
jgi:uncharacterized protein YozE (UPF0346 family)